VFAVEVDITAVNVPLDVNVCIVLLQEVVLVPPVEVALTQSLPSVAYDIITIPLPQLESVAVLQA